MGLKGLAVRARIYYAGWPVHDQDHGSEYLPTRRSLLERLANLDDQTSWRDFFNTYWKLIYNTAIRAGLSHADAEEVVQETVLTIMRRIRELKYDPALGSFKGWLLHTVRWRIIDQFRKQRGDDARLQHRDDGEPRTTATVERIPDSFDWEKYWEQDWQRNLMDAAIERVKQRVSPLQFQIFDLYVLKQWPVHKVARTLAVSVGQVYLAKHRVLRQLRREYRTLEREFF